MQQLHFFEKTDILVSVHNNVLVNIIFMVPNSAVIELFPPSYSSPLFFHLSSTMRLYYASVSGNRQQPAVCSSGRDCGEDFYRTVSFNVKSKDVENSIIEALQFVNRTKF